MNIFYRFFFCIHVCSPLEVQASENEAEEADSIRVKLYVTKTLIPKTVCISYQLNSERVQSLKSLFFHRTQHAIHTADKRPSKHSTLTPFCVSVRSWWNLYRKAIIDLSIFLCIYTATHADGHNNAVGLWVSIQFSHSIRYSYLLHTACVMFSGEKKLRHDETTKRRWRRAVVWHWRLSLIINLNRKTIHSSSYSRDIFGRAA